MANDDDNERASAKRDRVIADFYARGEQAWQDYLRTGEATPIEVVFARLEARIAAHRARVSRHKPDE